MSFYYKIAGLNVKIESFGRTLEQAKPYLSEGDVSPDIVVRSKYEKVRDNYPYLSDEDVEYLASGGAFYRELLKFDGFMLHSSAVVVDGLAYLFTANSGTGKSTHTALWLKQFGEHAYILNDDKPALRRIDGIWYAFGTPWSGKYDISVNTGVPLAGIAVLERDVNNQIEPYSGKDAVLDILRQANRPKAMEYRIKLMELLDQLIREVPIWKLRCNMEQEAAFVAYQAMSGGLKKGE
ncbi:MAG: hypothetical protein IJ412_05095 [Oscillospiraceae bacterium]|nr:hypothetical protein [Oscillospiraceae bacterium]